MTTQTDQGDTTADDEGGVSVELVMKPADPDTIELASYYLGIEPYVLIRLELDGDDVVMRVQAGGGIPQDAAQLAEVLRMIADTIADVDASSGSDR